MLVWFSLKEGDHCKSRGVTLRDQSQLGQQYHFEMCDIEIKQTVMVPAKGLPFG